MSNPVTAHQYLQQTTRITHERLEHHLYFSKANASLGDLTHYLLAMKPWLGAADALVWERGLPSELCAHERAQKSHWIRHDLDRLGVSDRAPFDWEPFEVQSEEQLLGLGYVLEGSTLGGRVLSRRFDEDRGGPFRYFEGYGAATSSMWRSFVSWLESSLTSQAAREEAGRGAVYAFEHLMRWLTSRGAAA